MEKISVLIRNRNEAEHIGFAIQSCIDNLIKPEIIVLDDHSKDDSLDVVSEFCFDNVNIVQPPGRYSPGAWLNEGFRLASHDTILVLSAHCQITEMPAVHKIDKLFSDFSAIFGKQIPIMRGKKITPRYVWSHFGDEEVVNMFSELEDRHFIHNAFCLYNRNIVGSSPFDPKLAGKEDRYWAAKAASRGYSYLYTPTMQANHFWTPNGATWK